MTWELQLLHWFEGLHNPVLNVIMYGFTMLGESGIFWILLGLFLIFYKPEKYRKAGFTILVALMLSLIFCNFVMKPVFHRVRPFVVDPSFEEIFGVFATAYDWSFPSGHTSASFAAALGLFCWRRKEGSIAIIIAALVSFSRLYFTVHYPTDVLASLVLGSMYGVLAFVLVRTILSLKKNRQNGNIK